MIIILIIIIIIDNSFLFKWVLEALSSGVKLPGREAELIKNADNYTFTPP
jgi:hypothetical protein